MSNRREFMKVAAGAGVVMLALPTLTDAITGCGPSPGNKPCPSQCGDGMVGMYPNCYYPGYRNLNVSWLQSWQAAMVSGYSSLKSSQRISPTLLSSVQGSVRNLGSHLLTTTAHEGFRKQWVGGSIWNAPNSQGANGLVDNLSPLGFNASDIESAYWGGSPNLATFAASKYPSLNAQINQLPTVYGSLDAVQSMATGDSAAMYVGGLGQLCTSAGGSTTLLAEGAFLSGISWLIDSLGLATGPAAPFVEAAGIILGAAGVFMMMAGTVCMMDGY